MRRMAVVGFVVALGANACGSDSEPVPLGQAVTTTSTASTVAASSTTVTPSSSPSTTRRSTPTTRPLGVATTAATAATTVAVATPTTVALTMAEANVKLCGQIEFADQAVTSGSFVAGGLRLASGISSYGSIANPGLVQLARNMLDAGKNGDAEGYVAQRDQAAVTCAALGRPIVVGGVQCVTAPCP